MSLQTLCDILMRLERGAPRPDQIRYRSAEGWREISTTEFVSTVRDLALGLATLGVGKGDRVALLSENRPEWIAFDQAILGLGAVVVPLYPSLLADQVRYILDHSRARILILSTPAQLAKVGPVLSSLPALERVVVIDAPEALPPSTIGWTRLLRDGAAARAATPDAFEHARRVVAPDDLASILYTSGTTGEPKGVMLTHSNFASNVDSTLSIIPFTGTDVALSFLPLSHAFERIVEFAYLTVGACIAYAESIEAVPRNLLEIEPTVVASVPRLFEKMHEKVMEKVRASAPHRRALFAAAMAVGRSRARALANGRHPSLPVRLLHAPSERLVLSPLRRKLFGSRIRFVISGGAPLGEEIAWFLFAAGIPVMEGYGLTETSPVVAVNRPDRHRVGTVGPVIPGVEVRIAPDGEVLVRGPNVMRGYYRDEGATRETMEDGWFRTGDVGAMDADGFLRITDRKKELLKTSGGKMVAPQPIEGLLKADPAIAQAVLVGDRKKFVAALIVPDFGWLAEQAGRLGIRDAGPPELIRDPRILEIYRGVVERRMEGLPPFERVKRFRLLPRELTQEAGELTPTLKVRRRVVEQRFADLIASMYRE
jgi:long-chain acyl-CoA synthetase